MDLHLRGKVVMVVGASAGIGAATARLLAREGAKLALLARRAPALEALATEIACGGGEVLALPADAADADAMAAAVTQIGERFGGLDAAAVVAGPMGARAGIESLAYSDWEFYFRHSLMLAVNTCRAAIPELLKHADSALVLTSAYSVRAPKPELIAYTAFKSAIASMAKNLAKSHGARGLRVNCVAPGVIEKSQENRRELAHRYGVTEAHARYEYVRREFGMNVALERAGRPEEFADLIVYLLSTRASYVTGSLVNIDGGTDF